MTLAELEIILAFSKPADQVKALQVSSFEVPSWEDLRVQYDAAEHPINDITKYPPKLNDNKVDDFERTPLALQKLAVNRLSQAMFATPVKRIWNYDRNNEAIEKAVNVIEEIYRVQNNIDSENLERAKKNNASCEVVTVWTAIEKPNQVLDLPVSNMKLVHKTYSSMDGYSIYANVDPYGEYVVISIGYKAKVLNEKGEFEEREFFDVYTNEESPKFIGFVNTGEWEVDTENSKSLELFPVVHTWMPEPAWGGVAGSEKVYQLEKQESYQGLYITRNALPTFTLDYGDTSGMSKGEVDESAQDSRRIITVGKGGNMQDVTWAGAPESVRDRYERLRNSFFEENQIPDTSFANLINSNTSAENKSLLFADSKARAIDLGGEWTKLFYDETQIVVKFVSIIYPSLRNVLIGVSSRSTIVPYDIKSKKELAEFVATGGDAMSLETKVRELDVVEDIQKEVDIIQGEASA